jgi:hypothetical protein
VPLFHLRLSETPRGIPNVGIFRWLRRQRRRRWELVLLLVSAEYCGWWRWSKVAVWEVKCEAQGQRENNWVVELELRLGIWIGKRRGSESESLTNCQLRHTSLWCGNASMDSKSTATPGLNSFGQA